jgi:BirA family transcriptional regulator, biotin operon repressor / biotin---[acetyl-CoA-carboxylase] ligase
MESNYNFNLICLDEVASTNQVLFRASFSDYPLGTALLARRQTAGRGRADRSWVSALGGMYLSALFLPGAVEGLTLLGALCAVRMCREDFGVPVVLRWPNDVYYQGRKLCGVLPQVKYHGQTLERVVLGVGMNVSQSIDDFPEEVRATTLAQLCPNRKFEIECVAGRYLQLLSEELGRFEQQGCKGLAQRCEEFLETGGRGVGVSAADGTITELGQVAGLGPTGELILSSGSKLSQLGVDERLVVLKSAGRFEDLVEGMRQ